MQICSRASIRRLDTAVVLQKTELFSFPRCPRDHTRRSGPDLTPRTVYTDGRGAPTRTRLNGAARRSVCVGLSAAHTALCSAIVTEKQHGAVQGFCEPRCSPQAGMRRGSCDYTVQNSGSRPVSGPRRRRLHSNTLFSPPNMPEICAR